MAQSRTAAAAAGAAVVLLGFVGFLGLVDASEHTVLVVNNLLQTVSAVGAGLVCAAVAWRSETAHRPGWAAMAVALVGWGLGQAYWSWSEIVAERATPFPSPADIGFLIFPAAAAVAVGRFQKGAWRGRSQLRTVSDGLLVSTSLFIISWVVVLDSVYAAGGDSRLAFGVALAYPIGDLVVVTLVFRLLAQRSSGRLSMGLLSAGLLAMGVADSGFAYLSTAGTYSTGSVIDVGWVAAFLLCAVAAVADSADDTDGREVEAGVSRLGLFLPLLPFCLGIIMVAVAAWRVELDRTLVVAGALLVVLIVLRQLLVLTENHHLVATVRHREEQLRHQAFHDPLTGLANRLLFRDRVEHATALRQRDRRDLTVLYLDLDDFKVVNDRWGHATGDALLVDVAERLRACLRQGDTVARLGGDEFAVLLEDDSDGAEQLACRVIDAMEMPFQLGSQRLRVTGSVGVATLPTTGDVETVPMRLLQCADVAMYAAKRGSKGSYVVYGDGMRMEDADVPHQSQGAEVPAG